MGEEPKKARVAKVKGNFNRIARDLDRALRLACLETSERYLFDEARELCWSFASSEPRPFRFNISAMARLSGLHRVNLSRRCRVMIERCFFVDLGDGSLLIEKDYRRWLKEDGCTQLLTDEQIAWCLSIRRDDPGCNSEATPPVTPELQSGFNGVQLPRYTPIAPTLHPCNLGATPPVTPELHPSHYKDRAPELLTREEREERAINPPERGGVREEDEEPSRSPGKPAADPPDSSVCNDPAEVARVAAFAEGLFPMLEFGTKVTAFANMYPIEWIRDAVERAHAAGNGRWSFALGILRRYQAQGGVDAPPPSAVPARGATATATATRPLSKQDQQIAEFRRRTAEMKLKEATDGEG